MRRKTARRLGGGILLRRLCGGSPRSKLAPPRVHGKMRQPLHLGMPALGTKTLAGAVRARGKTKRLARRALSVRAARRERPGSLARRKRKGVAARQEKGRGRLRRTRTRRRTSWMLIQRRSRPRRGPSSVPERHGFPRFHPAAVLGTRIYQLPAAQMPRHQQPQRFPFEKTGRAGLSSQQPPQPQQTPHSVPYLWVRRWAGQGPASHLSRCRRRRLLRRPTSPRATKRSRPTKRTPTETRPASDPSRRTSRPLCRRSRRPTPA
mmetsp:Transcript_144345/g.462407  ORF Transcript_144345/g.462407 Transcript_144345/m.462407 type:complete len:263 (+) Transcript_144345:670-1458(+)